jgi:PAS domain S-box-containing protein
MDWQYPGLAIVPVLAGVCSLFLATYAWSRRERTGAVALAILLLGVAVWCLAYAAELSSSSLWGKVLWAKAQYLGIVVVPVGWLTFVVQYTGGARWLRSRAVAWLAVVPVATLLLAWTNELHHLIWVQIELIEQVGGLTAWRATYGWGFWMHTVYSYAMLLLGSLVLVQVLVRSPRFYRSRVCLLLLSAALPWVGNLLSVFGLVSLPLDLTPLGFAGAGVLLLLALFRVRLLDVSLVARDTVVEGIADGLLVLDDRDRVLDVNPAAERMLGRAGAEMVGLPLDDALPDHPSLVRSYREATSLGAKTAQEGRAYLEVVCPANGENEDRHYATSVAELQLPGGRATGHLVLLRDVTLRSRTEEALRAQQELFRGLVAVARATAERPSLHDTLNDVLTTCARVTEAEYGTLLTFDQQGQVLQNLAMDARGMINRSYTTLDDEATRLWFTWAGQHHEPLIAPDIADIPYLPSLSQEVPEARSALIVPIVSGSMSLGVLALIHSGAGHFAADHANLMRAAGDQLGLALRNARYFDTQQRVAEHQSTLFHVLRSVANQRDPENVMQTAVQSIAQFAGWHNVAIALVNEERTIWEVGASAEGLSSPARLYSIEEGVIGRALRMLETQCVPDVAADPDYVIGYPNTRSELVVPLRHGERLIGALDIESDQPDAFREDDVLLAESLGDTLALAIENATRYAETHRQATDLGVLYTVTRMTSHSLSLESVLSQALTSVLISLEFEAGLIALADPVDGHLYLAAEYGLPRHMSERYHREGMSATLSEYVHQRAESVTVRDFRKGRDDEVARFARQLVGYGLRGYAGIPLLHRHSSLGTMSVFCRRPNAISSRRIVLLEALGRQVAAAVTNARLFQETVNERQRLVTLIESSRDGIILIDLEERILVINSPALEFMQLPGASDQWRDRDLAETLGVLSDHAPEAAERMVQEMARVREGDEAPSEWECTMPPRIIQWTNLPVVANDLPLGRLLAMRDVTEERMLARMRSDLVHTMVHDLRNPLTGISTALKLLEAKLTGRLTPAQHRLMEIADGAAEKMIDLVAGILDVSRLESGQMPIRPAPLSLRELVDETIGLEAPIATANRLKLRSTVPRDLPLAWADADLIRRVLQNLVGNAVKFTPPGGQVEVRAAKWYEADEERARESLCISVIDTGPGVPTELRPSLFQKFAVGQQEERGTGLGLAFCRLAVEAHGGRIWVESEEGQGAAFHFTLPTAQAREGNSAL